MLVQEKQTDMPQYLVILFLCTGQLSRENVFFRVYAFKARVYIDTFYSNQTILEFCENRFDN